MIQQSHEPSTAETAANCGILGLDHLEFYVGNPRHGAHFYKTTFGLRPTAYAGLETGMRDRCSYVASRGDVRFVLTGSVSGTDEVARHVTVHGDGVKDIAFRVADVDHAFHVALSRGARAVSEPTVYYDGERRLTRASISAFGDVVHSFIQRDDGEWFLPSFQRVARDVPAGGDITAVDHVAVSLPEGTLAQYVDFYTNVLGFIDSHEEYVRTEHSAMNSRVVQSADGQIRLPLLEPAGGNRKSQVQEYLDYHGGPGVQHAALLCGNIVETVMGLNASGVDFLRTPAAYYEHLLERVGTLEEDVSTLQSLNILVDKDPWGYLMQIFSQPLQSRPTFFVEVIQRKGARGFGSGSIKALFEAFEREQRRRGNL